jgi:mono/diheme cytochrome c family protein
LVAQAEAVLLDSCGDCHGGEPSPLRCGTCDGMYYVENLRRLVESGNIVPCRWQDSLVYQRIADGSMPPPGSRQNNGGTLEDEDVELVGEVVNGMCSNLTDGGPADTQRADIERWLGADCGSCHGLAAVLSGVSAPSALDGVGDIAELITAGLIVPCDADGSELVRVLRDESMPPPGSSGPRPGRAELTELIAFINRPCARR